MGLSFSDLMTQETIAQIRARIVAGLKDDGFPVDSWAPSGAGGVENMRLDMSAGLGAFMPARVVQFVTGRILPLSTGDYLKALGARFYGLAQRDATKTIQNLALYAVGSGGSYTFQPGDLTAKSDRTGHLYQSITGGQFSADNTGPAGGGPPTPADRGNPLMVQFEAEVAGAAYSDGPGTITTLVTARAGVRCTNIAPADFTPARLIGTSTGNVLAFLLDPSVRVPYSSIRIRIDVSGDIGTGQFSWSTDAGVTWTPGGVIFSGFFPVFAGTALAFSNGGVSPSFIAGDIFTLYVADAILRRGADAESESAFRRRCANRWPSLSDVPVAATIELWAHLASEEVAKVGVDADPSTSGGIIITLASATGPASPAAQIAVEDYVGPRLLGYKGVPAPATTGFTSPEESVTVTSAQAFNVTAAGPVRVPRAQLATAQVDANNNWNDYLAGLPLGGQQNAIIELAKLAEILADAGAIDIPDAYAGLLLNGAHADLTIPAGLVAVPAPGQSLLSSMTWIPV